MTERQATATITVTLSEVAQRAAVVAGEPAARTQEYPVPAELLADLLSLPWSSVDKDGSVRCVVSNDVRSIQFHGVKSEADVRPADVGAAIQHGKTVAAAHTAEMERRRAQREANERHLREEARARAERWARRSLELRVTPDGFVAIHAPDLPDDPTVPLSNSGGYQVVAWDALREYAPAALAEAETLAAQRRTEWKAAEAATEAKAQAEIADWIAAHGTPRLQRLLAEDIEHGAVYRDERLAVERPGWRYLRGVRGEHHDPRNPPQAAIDLLDEARVSEPDAKLVYWEVYMDDESDRLQYRGYTCIAPFLGRRIVYRVADSGMPPVVID